MTDQIARAEAFRAMHVAGRPLILFNVWDAGSAKAVAGAGAKALATGSASVASAHGYPDGEAIPLDLAIANAARIVASTDLPVSLDLERGYGAGALEVGETVARALETGIIGCNIEDSLEEGGPLRETSEQARRIAAARAAADRARIPLAIASSRSRQASIARRWSTRHWNARASMRTPGPTACSCRCFPTKH
jgi:2-methylisocitrate lyase-like PEP mutase family enzyme